MQKLYQYKSKDPSGTYFWSWTEIYGTIEQLKLAHQNDPDPEWREVCIVEAELLYCLERDSDNLNWLREAFWEIKRRLRV